MSGDPDMGNLDHPHCFHRSADEPIEVRECFCGRARDALGRLEPGCQIFGFTKGQFSLMDLLIAIVSQTGPCEMDLSTWTAATADLEAAYKFSNRGEIRDLRFVVDRSFPTRQPDYCETLRERFGDEAIRVTRTHAKFVTARNDDWSIVCMTSMNLNHNPRFEDFFLVDDDEVCQYMTDMVDKVFAEQDVGAAFDGTTTSEDGHFQSFELLGDSRHPTLDDGPADVTLDTPEMDL
jgi:hypothetical protein